VAAGGATPTALLADIGGTNARFALSAGDSHGPVLRLPVAEHATSYDAVAAALERLGGTSRPETAVLAFAGPTSEARADMTNAGWTTTADELRRRFGFRHVRLLNDYAALSLGLAHLTDADRRAIGPARPPARGPLAVLGPGSGLGVGALLSEGPRAVALVSEGGHATMPAVDEVEVQIFALLHEEFGHVSAERVLSGPGLVNLYRCVARLDGAAAEPLDAAAVTQRGLAGSDPRCTRALEHFCLLLGTFAGNTALTLGAHGGVFLAGGILPRFPDFLAASGFRRRFEDKGRLSGYLAAIPTWLVTRPDAAFVGLCAAAREMPRT
jgi:glucokinase